MLCLLFPFLMMGQAPVANFSASVTSGCSPLGVTFTDQSTGTPKFWTWDFGNGQLSNAQNPPAQSYAAGTYSVTLVVRNADGVNSITKTNLIVSSPSPSASFTSDKTITCLPATINFTDLSVANAGTLTKWEWAFDDPPATSSAQNPQHIYTKVGYYGVYLKVTNSAGCSSATYAGRYIRILNGVKANFDFTGPATCSPPFVLNYNNLTSGPGNLSYSWDLGNGNTSTLVKPVATYNTAGSYTVKLKAQSDFGCSDSIQKTFPVNGIVTAFTAPANACLGSPVTFQNTSSAPPVSVLWDFGDGTSSNQLSPSKTYTSLGTYTVTLHTNFGGCADSASKTITVNGKPMVNFGAAKSNSCKAPFPVTFQNSSPDVVSANWTFGDGSTSNAATPTVAHTYNSTGSFDVTLNITDSKGCSNSLTLPTFVNIFAPVVSIKFVPIGLCVGQTFAPSPSIGSVDPVVSYLWDFGDGTSSTAMVPPPHSYSSIGTKIVTLTITTQDGCTASASNNVQVGTPPLVSFTANKTNLCRSDIVTFTNTSSPIGNTVLWDFGDTSTSTALNTVTHKFLDTGFFSIKLRVTNNGCADSLIKTNFIYVQPPLAKFGYKVDCLNKTNVNFLDSSATDASKPPLTYLWKFGDPGAGSAATIGNTNFTYPALTTYTATLIINNGSCADTATRLIRLVNEKAAFTFNKTPAAYCRNDSVTVTSTNIAANVKKYEWVIDGAAPVTGSGKYTAGFGTTGNHSIRLIVTDINGCIDSSAASSFIISGPTALFGLATKGGCASKTTTFSDSSISTGTISKWTFDFGDGVTKSFTAPPFTHVYADTGSYTVKLTVNDNIGCQDSYQLPAKLLVTKPKASFTAPNTVSCPNGYVQFRDSSVGVKLQYVWSFGDGSTDVAQNPSYTYGGTDSFYTVKLVVTDTSGCTDSLTRVNYISIKRPKPIFTAKDTASLCPPLETRFFFKGKDYDSFAWDFGDGSPTSSLDSTSHFYNTYGKYTAKLYVTGFGGCMDSASVNINVTNPYTNTTVTFNPVTACNELTANFNVTKPIATSFQLFFGDGAVDSSQQLSFSHFYSLPNLYQPAILLLDSSSTTGCQVYFGNFGNVDVKGAVPIFGMDKKKFCDSGTIYFTDYSQDGRDPIISRNWDFGDGTANVSTKDAIHSFLQPGLYVPTLTVTAASGCAKAFTDTVRVLATPTPIIGSKDGICIDLAVDFTGSLLVPPDTAIVWKWNLGNGQTSGKQNVSLNYADSGLYHITLEAVNSLGCKGDTSKDIRIFPLPKITLTGDTTLIAGAGGAPIPVTYSANAVGYNWTPPAYLSCTNCAVPFANPKFTTKYNVKVTDVNGCISSRDITLVVVCNNRNFFIPNTFSPNNDGTNDRFYPRGTGLDRIQALRIFNRWGELVFEKRNFPANDATAGWDGSYRGKPASTDTYIYMVDIICENANIITYKGNVTLVR